jgi:hypothetical protein
MNDAIAGSCSTLASATHPIRLESTIARRFRDHATGLVLAR